jgi:beta-N-acetylhexosaminidase
MKKLNWSFIVFLLVLVIFQGRTVNAQPLKVKDLVIDLNVPQVTRGVAEGRLPLNALHVYHDGRFMLATEDLVWKSSNKNVASVTEDGVVSILGNKGKTFISVSDGKFTDRISIQSKGNQDTIILVKEAGKRYDLIGKAIKHMTIEEKVGQMLMPDFIKWKGKNVTEMNAEIAGLVRDYHLGGVILFGENTVTPEQTTRLVHAYQQAAGKYGLFISVDQEGGLVTRLQSGTDFPGNMALGAAGSVKLAEKVGKAIGVELHAQGINMNFGPVLDVNNNPDNPVIGVRSFGEDPNSAGKLGKAYIRGLQETGTAATAKHFPGHGDTAEDSHLGLPRVPHGMKRLKQVELYPFQQAMNAGIDAIMTTHVTFPKIDHTKVISKKDGTEVALPATLSYQVLTNLMRKEMGYNGVIVTDGMNMRAITEQFGPVEAAIEAVKAGADILLMPVGIVEVAKGLYEAIDSNEISTDRIEQSVERILTLKLNRMIVKAEVENNIDEMIANARKSVGSAEHKALEKEAAEESITLVKNNGVLPLQVSAENKIVIVGSSAAKIAAEVRRHHPNVAVLNKDSPLSAADIAIAKTAKFIIIGTSTGNGRLPAEGILKLVKQVMNETEAPVIAIGLRNPYDISSYPAVDAYLAQYGTTHASFEASVKTIFGANHPTGQLPVTIKNPDGSVLYELGHGLGY